MSDRKKLHNARIKTFGSYVPVKDVEPVDCKEGVWKGNRIVEPGTPEDVMLVVYFSRAYSRDNEIDKMVQEYHITDESIMGYEFWLIPKEKLLFGYDPPSPIIEKPPIRLTKPRLQI